MMLDELAFFVCIVESGSLNAAAQKLEIPPATLTRRLQKLEKAIGCRLLHRSARRLLLTREGNEYYEQCRPLIHALQQTTDNLDRALNQVSGLIRVLAPVNLAASVLAPAWGAFIQRYPEIRLELELDNLTRNLIGNYADLAIRVGRQPDSSLNMRRLGGVRLCLVASPGYLQQRGYPEHPDRLDAYDLLVAEPLSVWFFQHTETGQQRRWRPQARFRVNDLELAVQTACAGAGLLLCPLSICFGALERGDLVEVFPSWQTEMRDIYAVWPQQRYVPARVRALIEFLADYVAGHPVLTDIR